MFKICNNLAKNSDNINDSQNILIKLFQERSISCSSDTLGEFLSDVPIVYIFSIQ